MATPPTAGVDVSHDVGDDVVIVVAAHPEKKCMETVHVSDEGGAWPGTIIGSVTCCFRPIYARRDLFASDDGLRAKTNRIQRAYVHLNQLVASPPPPFSLRPCSFSAIFRAWVEVDPLF